MQRIKKSTKMFILTLLMVLCCFAGLFFVFQKKQEPMKADAAETIAGFYMEEGMALNKNPKESYIRLTVNITPDMYNKLSRETTTETKFGETVYNPTPYYLRIVSLKNGQDFFTRRYHIDPKNADLYSEKIQFNASGTKAYLEFPIVGNYEIEYIYIFDFLL